MVKSFNSTYANTDLEQVANNASWLNAEKRNQLLGLLKYFEDLFDGLLGNWDTDPAKL